MQYELIAFVLRQHNYRLIFCALGNVGVRAESHSRDNNIMINTIFEYYNSRTRATYLIQINYTLLCQVSITVVGGDIDWGLRRS